MDIGAALVCAKVMAMSQCARCGSKLGLFESPPMCGKCNKFLKDALPAFDQRVDWMIAERYVTAEKEADLRAYQEQLGLSDWDISAAIQKIHRAKALMAINLGDLPSIPPGNVMLPRGEVCHFATQAALYQEQVQRAYVSKDVSKSRANTWHGRRGSFFGGYGSRRGASDHTHVGQWVQTAQTVCVAQGVFLVTNENVRFVSHAMATIPLVNIIGFNWYWNAIELQYDGRDSKDFYAVHDGEMAASVLVAARRRLDGPEEPYR